MTESLLPRRQALAAFVGGVGALTAPALPSLLWPAAAQAAEPVGQTMPPLIIGHRGGGTGYRPEHTRGSYEFGIEAGVDYIEPDLVATKDGVLVVRHENDVSGTTDALEKFPDRKTKKAIDGKEIEGVFTEDLTLAEVKTLRAKERLAFRNHGWDGVYEVLTFQEVIDIAKAKSREKGRTIGIYPETKHPTYFKSIGLPLEGRLVEMLNRNGYTQPTAPVFIQSFEVANLRELRTMTKVPLILLFEEAALQPYDFVAAGDKRTYGDLTKPAALAEIATFANGIGPYKRLIVPEGPDHRLLPPTSLVADAHRAGLRVHPYTFRDEPTFLAADYKLDPIQEYLQFFELGVDGLFSDNAISAARARQAFLQKHRLRHQASAR